MTATSTWSEGFVEKLSDAEYRNAYLTDQVRTALALQVRALREQRGWSQAELGRRMGKPQSVVSRLEDPDYGKVSLQTLFELAQAFDVPLVCQFADWQDWLQRMGDVSEAAFQKPSFNPASLKVSVAPKAEATLLAALSQREPQSRQVWITHSRVSALDEGASLEAELLRSALSMQEDHPHGLASHRNHQANVSHRSATLARSDVSSYSRAKASGALSFSRGPDVSEGDGSIADRV